MDPFLSELITRYGYIGIFAALSLGIVGLPIPDETLLTYTGYNVFQGKMVYSLAVISAFLGAATGITISYGIGYKLGLPFLRKFGPKIHITTEKIERTERYFKKYGNFLLFIGYFIPGVRHLTAYLAGIARDDLRKFMIYAYSGALCWSITFISIGHELGEKWFLVEEYIHRYGRFLPIALFVIVIGVFLFLHFRRSKVSS
ncbi:DedA family protein [Shimazuella sp. AN120528]|uniref:DedA family protein n=1 Tax=Shimazuella soli TaxID=1892854 RepID=UPI001F10BE3F|nr:DedA family protein [Shimazuella soli]MCH5584393.1 DedA family protein [Shimazuella soli]